MACDADHNGSITAGEYDIYCDDDIAHVYDTDDLQDITKSGMGESAREVVANASFLVFLIVIAAVLGIIGAIIVKTKLAAKKMK